MNNKKQNYFYRNSLSIVFISLFVIVLGAQAFFGWKEHNKELKDLGAQEIMFSSYLAVAIFSLQLLRISRVNFYKWRFMSC